MNNEAARAPGPLHDVEQDVAEMPAIAVEVVPEHDAATSGRENTSVQTLQVSVVLPTCGRPRLLRRCLGALLRQTLPAEAFEVIVVDDGRSERTEHLVAWFAERGNAPRIAYLRPPSGARGPAAARNAGWRAARARLIAFTDDDTVPAREWLAAGLASLPDWASAAAGRVHVPLPRRPSDWELSTAGLDGAEFVTANCFVRRAALERVGGFDERYARPWREDSDLYFGLLEKGYRVVAAPEAAVLHPVRAAPWGVSLKLQHNMLYDALLYKKHRDLYRAKISPLPPVRYYLVSAALLAAVGYGIGGHPGIASLFAAGWLAWTLWFAAHRLRSTRRDLRHVAEMLLTSAAIPLLSVFWRLAGAVRFRVLFA